MSDPLYDRLKDFQKIGVEMLSRNRNFLLADDVGVGKTAQVLMAARALGAQSILILCPSSIKYDYPRRLVEWGHDPRHLHVVDTKNAGDYFGTDHGVFIINYDICFRKEVARVFARKKYDVLICDESHNLKNHKGARVKRKDGSRSSGVVQRTKAVLGHGGYASLAAYRWFVTGTPILNCPREIYTTIKTLFPGKIQDCLDYISFTKKFCGGHQGTWGWVADGATNIDELVRRLDGCMLRRERDILPELPERIMRKVYLKKTAEIEKMMFQESDLSIRQKIGLAKVNEITDYVHDVLEKEPKVIVFAYHHTVIDELERSLSKSGALKITGNDSSQSKNIKKNCFIDNPKCKVLIIQIDAAGTGVDGLQGACRHAIFAEITYVPGVNQQAMGRIHRHGQKHKTIFDFLTVEGSFDESIIEKNLDKSDTIKKLLQDDNHIFSFDAETQTEDTFMQDGSKVSVVLTFDLAYSDEVMTDIVKNIANSNGVSELKCNFAFQVGKIESSEPKAETRGRKPKEKKETYPAIVGPDTTTTPSAFDAVDAPAPAVETPAPTTQTQVSDPFSAAEPAPAPVAELTYEQFIRKTANTIQEKIGAANPGKINEMLGALNKGLKDKFPKYANVLQIKDAKEQAEVKKLVGLFMTHHKLA